MEMDLMALHNAWDITNQTCWQERTICGSFLSSARLCIFMMIASFPCCQKWGARSCRLSGSHLWELQCTMCSMWVTFTLIVAEELFPCGTTFSPCWNDRLVVLPEYALTFCIPADTSSPTRPIISAPKVIVVRNIKAYLLQQVWGLIKHSNSAHWQSGSLSGFHAALCQISRLIIFDPGISPSHVSLPYKEIKGFDERLLSLCCSYSGVFVLCLKAPAGPIHAHQTGSHADKKAHTDMHAYRYTHRNTLSPFRTMWECSHMINYSLFKHIQTISVIILWVSYGTTSHTHVSWWNDTHSQRVGL